MIGQEKTARVWMVLTFGDDRQYAGNSGYEDDPGRWYSYDSYVANHRQVAAGHCVILCDRRRALGIARIETIDSEPSSRQMQRCPVCGATGIKKRKSMQPEYRCNKGHEFDAPVTENAKCTKYVARFGATFTPFDDRFDRQFLRAGCPRYSDQLAMQEFDFGMIEDTFRERFPSAASLIHRMISVSYLQAETADEKGPSGPDIEGYALRNTDERGRILKQICARRGQQEFRDSLRTRYGDSCMISGCTVLHVLEAAHICPYRGDADNHVDNGLLLRADIHTLFDLDLIGIEPATLKVHIHPNIQDDDYRRFGGKTLALTGRERPSVLALNTRWEAFQKRTASSPG